MTTEAARITLRPLTRDEAEAIVTAERSGRAWATDYPTAGDVAIAGAALAGSVAFPSDDDPWGLYVIIDLASAHSVGGIGFKHSPNERGEVEIGYGVCASLQGRGVATAAVLAMCEIARHGARAVLAETERANVASQRVLEKSGFLTTNVNSELISWRKELV